jgi:zinc transport system permease protein
MLEIFSLRFMQVAFVSGSLVAVICAILGLYIVLRKLSFLADGIAHISFSGLAIAIVSGTNVIAVTLAVALLSALGINRMREKLKISADAAIGIMFPVGLSIGILLLSIFKITSIDLSSYLFGSILAISEGDLFLILLFGAIVLACVFYLQKQLFYIAFDEESAKAAGINVALVNNIFFALSGVGIVLALRVAGVLLVSALLIIPASTALRFKRSFRDTMALSCVFAVLSTWIGISASYYIGVPTGAAIALSSFAFFAVSALLH